MPLIDEFFGTANIAIVEHERDLETGVQAHVELQFTAGFSGLPGKDGQPDPLYCKRTKLDPSSAIGIGKALIEAGEKLAGPDLAVVTDMTAADAEAQAQDRLRNGADPSRN